MHGQPDYGLYSRKSTTFGLADLGELVARLGGINTFDRRGDTVWQDDFESDVSRWSATIAGAGGSVVASSKHARNGAFSAKITAGDGMGSSTMIRRRFAVPASGRIGFEISFSVESDTRIIELHLGGNPGSNKFAAAIRYSHADSELLYYDTVPAWVPFATGIELREYDELFHTAKLVVDLATHKYVRFILGRTEYDMTAYEFYHTPLVEVPYMHTQFQLYGPGLVNPVCYADDAIMTQNEP